MSTGTTGAIKGGMAYVQAYLDDNEVSKGLAKLQMKLRSWQASLSKAAAGAYGGELPEPFAALARFAASPAGAFSALLGAAKLTADAREEMFRMSETTGVTVEKLSALAYAARRAGVSNEALASGLRKMQSKEFQAMIGGGKKAGQMQGIMAGLGLDKSKDAADQFRQIVAQFEKLDAVSRVGLAKKLGISELLPLINQGVDQLDAFTARAKELGLVMSEADAKAGKRFGLAMGDLHDVLMNSVSAIGGALVPCITGLTNITVRVVTGIRDWLKDHQALTQAIFFGTGAIVAGGVVLKGFSIMLGIAAKGVNLLGYAVKGLKVAFDVLSVGVSWLPLLANPWVLAGLAIGGVVVWIAKLSGAFDGLSSVWKGFSADFSDSFGAISNALAKGDIQAAWNVVTAFLKTEWIRVTNYLGQAWSNFSDYFMGLLDKYAPWVSTVLRAIVKAWDWLCDNWRTGLKWLTNTWSSMCGFLEKTFGATARYIMGLWDKILDKIAEAQKAHDLQGVHKRTISPRKMQSAATLGWAVSTKRPQSRPGRPKARPARPSTLLTPSVARPPVSRMRSTLRPKKRPSSKSARSNGGWKPVCGSEAAQLQLKQAVDAANAGGPGGGLTDKQKKAFDASAATENRGTFSGSVAALLGGGGSVAQQQLKAAEEQSEYMRKLAYLVQCSTIRARFWAN